MTTERTYQEHVLQRHGRYQRQREFWAFMCHPLVILGCTMGIINFMWVGLIFYHKWFVWAN